MNLFVTFVHDDAGGRRNIANGFSFVRHLVGGVDIFLMDATKPERIRDAIQRIRHPIDRIFCSISVLSQLRTLRPILDERWVLGGPAACLAFGKIDLPCELVTTTFENYLGIDQLSSTFSFYFERHVTSRHITSYGFNCSLGMGCYWNRCAFCSYNDYYADGRSTMVNRPNIPDILGNLRVVPGSEALVRLCASAFSSKVLAEILDTPVREGILLNLFSRADPAILSVVERYGRFNKGTLWGIGLETLSQGAMRRLNKGQDVDNVLKLSEMILARGGRVSLSIMDHFPFMTREMAEEGRRAAQTLKRLVARYGRRIAISNNGITRWYSKRVVEEMAEAYRQRTDGIRTWYEAVIDPGSEAFLANRTVSQAIVDSGVHVKRNGFVSLASTT